MLAPIETGPSPRSAKRFEALPADGTVTKQ